VGPLTTITKTGEFNCNFFVYVLNKVILGSRYLVLVLFFKYIFTGYDFPKNVTTTDFFI
jgi:hypothetical protein